MVHNRTESTIWFLWFVAEGEGMNIAIVGLGRVGAEFLRQMLVLKEKGVDIIAAVDPADTIGKKDAMAKGIAIRTLDEVIEMGENLDIIFDLSGKNEVRKEIREKLQNHKNNHTVLAPEIILSLFWMFIEDNPLPDVHDYKGY